MGRRSVLVTGGILLAAVAMFLVPAVAVGSGFTGGCQSGPMELDELLASDSVVGVTRHDAFADRPGLKVWAPGSAAKATAVWGVAGEKRELTTSGGRFNIIPEGEDGCATQRVGTSWPEALGPRPIALVHGRIPGARPSQIGDTRTAQP